MEEELSRVFDRFFQKLYSNGFSVWSFATLPVALFVVTGLMKAQPIAASSEGMPLPQNTISIAQMPVSSETMPTADGIYLYGEAPASDRIGTAYMVFELRQSQAVGAFFMPHSSFDCFYGRVSPRALEVTVVNSYDRTAYDYAVALEDSAIASEANVTIEPEFEGFYPIESLSDSNRQILETCKDRYQNAVWQ